MSDSILKSVGDPGTGEFHTPRLDSEPWTLKLSGATARALVPPLSLEEVLSLVPEPYEQEQGVECVSAGNMTLGKPAVGFRGIPFATFAEYLGIDPNPERWEEEWPTVVFRSKARAYGGPKTEVHSTSLPLRDCLDPRYQVMLATHLEGAKLPYEHGGPLRIVVGPGLYFYKALKWLAEIEVVAGPLEGNLGTWEKYSGYHRRGRTEFQERFTPMLRRIVAAYRGEDGSIEDETIPLPPETYAETLKEALAEKSFSTLVGAKMQIIDPALWKAIPGRDLSSFAFKEGAFHAKLRGTSFAGFSFVGCDLAGCNFSLSIFSNAKFSQPDGSDPADLAGCDLEGANFQNAHLKNVSMQGATLTNVTFFTPGKFDQSAPWVMDLDVRDAKQLAPETRAWLEKNGAKVS